jgi:hypothetical protein
MQTATRNFPSGDLRVSDADRDRAVSELSEAFQAGRITADEFGQRSGQALAARTGKELTALLTDLPPDRVPAVRTGALGRARVAGTWIVIAASAAAAIPLAAAALSNALSTGPSLAVRDRAHRLSPRRRQAGGTEGRRAATRGRAVVGQRRARGPGHRVTGLIASNRTQCSGGDRVAPGTRLQKLSFRALADRSHPRRRSRRPPPASVICPPGVLVPPPHQVAKTRCALA